LIFFAFGAATAQDAHPSFKHYTVEDGLPSSEVYQVKQDSKGYIWFATGNGVSRFNGYEFENFSITDGLPDNTVFEIYEDKFERIWFVPLSCKLSYYYKGKIYPFQYNDQLQKFTTNPLKTSFCVDDNGTIFLGLHQGRGVIEVSKNGKITNHFPQLNVGDLDILEPDTNKFVYSYFENPENRVKRIMFHDRGSDTLLIPKEEIAAGASGRVAVSSRNEYLIGIGSSLIQIDKNNLSNYRVEKFKNRLIWVYEDRDKDLWVGTLPGGMYFIKRRNFADKKLFLSGLSLTGFLQDKEGGFWYSTEGNGVYYAPSKDVLVFDENVGFSDDRILCLAVSKTNVFAGSQNGFVEVIQDQKKVKTYDLNLKSVHSNEISAIFYDDLKDVLWVAGSSSGKIKNGRFYQEVKNPKFNEMIVDSSGVNWMVASGDFSKMVNGKMITIRSTVDFQKFKRMNAITEGKNNTLLIGALNGLWKYDKGSDNLEYTGYKNKLLQNRILDIERFSDSLYVLATKGAGIIFYDCKNVCQINSKKGLLGDNVYSLCKDSSIIWAATNKGLNKIVIKQRKPLKYKLYGYTSLDGLPSNEIHAVKKFGRQIWLATNRGLVFFYPDSINNKVVQLPVYINHILINDKDTAISSSYHLAYDENNIKINFTGLGYKNAGKLRYRYKMIGLDTDWNYTKAREVQYTTLPANAYTFVLNVQNSTGGWSTNEVRVHFRIRLPFWKEWWFILGMIALGIYVMFIMIRFRLKRVQLRNEKITDLNKTLMSLKLKALRAQMNPHFTFNVMNSIQHFIASNNGEAANRYLSRFSRLIRLILNNSERTVVPLADEIKALELYLELEVMRFEERFEYKITVDNSIDILEAEIPSMLIQPYVENSIKHGILNLSRPGIIKIDIEKQENFIKCTIEDNGVGRSESFFRNKGNLHKSFGTIITQERLAAINALNNSQLTEKITDLQDELGNATGTRVEIYIPFN
jgi:ligand-binding sensor domain-containing protein